jgi:TP901 family phage tail tape measure protein
VGIQESSLRVGVDSRPMLDGARRGQRALSQLSDAARTTENQFGRLQKAITPVRAAFATLASVGIGVFFTKVTREASQFETAFAEVLTLVDETTFNVERLSDALQEQAILFGSDDPLQAAAAYQIISAGAESAAEAIEILDASNRLAVGGVTEVSIAADGLTTILNAYGGSVTSASEASDVLFVGMRAGKTTIEELSTSLGRVVPLAASTGVSFEELVASVSALTTGGISTREAVTGVRAVLASVAKPTKEASDLAEKLGINFTAAGLESQGFASFLQEVVTATGGSTEELSLLFGGVEALLPILALAGEAGDSFTEILEQMQDSTGATEEAFNKMTNTFGFQAGRFQQVLGEPLQAVGNALTAVLTPAMRFVADNFEALSRGATVFASGITVALLPAILSLVPAAASATAGFIAMAAAFAATPFGLALATVTALSVAVAAFGDTTIEVADEQFTIWEGVRAAVSMVWDAIKLGVEIARDTFRDVTGFVQTFFTSAVEWISGFTLNWSDALSAIGQFIRDGINAYIGLWVGFLSSIRPVIVEGIPNLFKLAMAAAYNTVLAGLQNIIDAVTSGLGSLGDALDYIPGIDGVGDSIRKSLDFDLTDLKQDTEEFRVALDGVGDAVSENFADSMARDYVGELGEAVGDVTATLRDEFLGRIREAREVTDEFGETAEDAAVSAETLTDPIRAVETDARGAAGAMQELTDAQREFVDSLSEEYERIREENGGAVESVQHWYDRTRDRINELELEWSDYADMVETIFAERMEDAYRKDLEAASDWRSGLERALLDIGDSTAQTEADLMEGAFTSAFNNMASALSDFVLTGKLDFADLARSIIADIVKMTTRMLLFRAISSFMPGFGMAEGGMVLGYASGGFVSGPGGPTSDSIPAMLSDGEFVVNAAATQDFLPLLSAINNGDIQRLSLGGRVNGMPESVSDGEGGGAPMVNVTIQTRDAESFRQSRGQVAADIARAVAFGQRSM